MTLMLNAPMQQGGLTAWGMQWHMRPSHLTRCTAKTTALLMHACMQASFTSLDALVARIRRDGELSALALDDAVLQQYKADSFLAAAAAAAQAPGGEAGAAY